MRLPILTSLPVLLMAGTGLAGSFGPLVSPAELAAQIDTVQPIILDLRKEAPDQTYVPGAISAPYTFFRGPDNNPGQLPELTTLEPFFEQLGLEPDAAIVIVPEGKTNSDFGAAARVYWTLKSTGFTDLSILNGGEQAWRAAGFPPASHPDSLFPSELDLAWDGRWTALTADISAIVEGDGPALLVDARPAAFYKGRSGHEAAASPGTLPGAVNHHYAGFFPGDGPVISDQIDTAALKSTLGLEGDREVVAFCNTGHWAATEWFALSELAGLPDVKLYPGSMVEYSQSGAPMENQPGLIRNALRQIFGS